MAITWDDVVLAAPELSTLTVDQQNQLLALAYKVLSVGVCGDRLDECAVYLCAHIATANKRRGLGGAVTGQTVGSVSRQYAAPGAVVLGDLSTTAYGQTLELLMVTNPEARWTVA